jgi:hypothetical protein
MAVRERRAAVKKRKSIARGKVRKTSKSARGRAAKPTLAKPKKRLTKAKLKRAGAKGVSRKKVRPTKPALSPADETIIADVIEEPIPGVITITEFEETEVRNEGEGAGHPEGTPPPELDEP